MTDAPPAKSSLARLGALLLMAAAIATPGCWGSDDQASRTESAARREQRRISKSNTLLESATAQLKSLPDHIALDLLPPRVVLDSSSSNNGLDIFAIATPPQGELPIPLTTLAVQSDNVNFQSSGIKAGDTVKCYLLPDSATRDRLMATGELDTTTMTFESVDVEVATVTSPTSLLLSRGLKIPTSIALDLSRRISEEMKAQLRSQGLPEEIHEQFIRQARAANAVTPEGVDMPAALIASLQGVAWPFRVEVWRTDDARMIEINNALGRYAKYNDPPLAWEPSPDAGDLAIIIERLNQWLRSRNRPADWKPAALSATLPESLTSAEELKPIVAEAALAAGRYSDHDGRLIQEAIWSRDIGRWAGGGRFEPVELASSLFDWTVRNVTLTDDPRMAANRPWQTMLYGRGDAAQRAWVFAWLCRQQRRPVLVLELPTDEGAWLWCGLMVDGKLYLFDPQLGLPIKTTDGAVATLADVVADDSLLRALDLDDASYPITSEVAAEARPYVVADPFSLSWRSEELQQQFSAEDALTLFTDADSLAAEASAIEGLGEVGLWLAPLELLQKRLTLGPLTRSAIAVEFRPYSWRPRLWKARVLQMRGSLETEADARKRNDALHDPIDDHQSAGRLYTNRSTRPSDAVLARQTPDKRGIYERSKADATYWMGLLQYERGNYQSSAQWLEMAREEPDDPTRRGAGILYNLARALEANGELTAAADLLESSESRQRHGDRLRAAMLRATVLREEAEAEPAG